MKQNHKKIIGMMLAFIIAIFGVLFFVDANESNWCVKGETGYRDCVSLIGNIEQPVLWSFLSLFLITIGLFFVRRQTFIAWAIFASIAFPLMFGVLLYTFNNKPTMGGWIGGPTDDQIASVLLPGLFIIISLVIIAMKSGKSQGD